ncbi:hypothetical protein AB595_10610 [Massilia sp. WF1]|uniref:hypothetical protein n=1 Tax=unclassified Massilia TaxID=2609279 RepID=UPI00064963F3|nr:MULTISPECIES: hypothetical protein [unclassified Massilia]ALK99901.1 hypothetical protein AM586_26920 [Massilia sp. WG5]KLU36855.1 hypothetical protein AB595_10610 [Massilia sp. WF1]
MKTIPVGTRLDVDLHRAFEEEMKRRGQDKAELLRTFIRDGLARYDSYSEQIMQTQLSILEHMKKLQEMMGAALHLNVEQAVLGLRQGANETSEAYKERLMSEYRKTVFEALGKGGRIATVAATRTANAKVGHDH